MADRLADLEVARLLASGDLHEAHVFAAEIPVLDSQELVHRQGGFHPDGKSGSGLPHGCHAAPGRLTDTPLSGPLGP